MLYNKKSTILFFVSLIGIVITSLMLVTTYAYQTVQTKYEEGANNNLGGDTGIQVGNLEINYTSSNKIELTNIPFLPDYKSAEYTEFTIDNTKSTDDVGYNISLVDLVYDSVFASSDFCYTLVKVNNNYTLDVIGNGNFKNLTGSEKNIYYNFSTFRNIEKGTKETLRLYLWLKENNENQEDFTNTSFKGKVKITSLFYNEVDVSNSSLFSEVLINSAKSVTDEENSNGLAKFVETPPTSSSSISGESESVLSIATDNYGNSYYFRGNVKNNYLNFAGMCWRIVRILGNGNIRIVLEDQYTTCNDNDNTDGKIYTGNWGIKKGAYGHIIHTRPDGITNTMGDYLGATNGMAVNLQNFQNTKLLNYHDYLSAGDWCLGNPYLTYGYTSPLTEIEANKKIFDAQTVFYLAGSDLTCVGNNLKEFKDGTEMLVGAMNSQELTKAGLIFWGSSNIYTYLTNEYQMTNNIHQLGLNLRNFSNSGETYGNKGYDNVYVFEINNSKNTATLVSRWINDGQRYYRPTITLVAGTEITGGEGLIGNPYEIK